MKNIAIFVVAMSLMMLGCRVSDIRDFKVEVPLMAEQADVQKVQAALAALPGVIKDKTVFDLQTRVVIVCYDSMVVAHKNIEIAIAEAGYDANGISVKSKK